MKRKVIGLLRSAKILIIRSLAQSRIMEIENFIKVDNLVFQKITEVGNLCRVMVFYFSLRSVICRVMEFEKIIDIGNLSWAGST